jgi:hypothetical protein
VSRGGCHELLKQRVNGFGRRFGRGDGEPDFGRLFVQIEGKKRQKGLLIVDHLADPLLGAAENCRAAPFVLSARIISFLCWEIYVANRREWTTQDVRELKKLAKHKTPTAKIARALKRTQGATRQKVFSLGVSLDTRT